MEIGIVTPFHKLNFERKFNQPIQLLENDISKIDLLIVPGGYPLDIDSVLKEKTRSLVKKAYSADKKILATGDGFFSILDAIKGDEIYVTDSSQVDKLHPTTHDLTFPTTNANNIFFKFYKDVKVNSNHSKYLPAQRTIGTIGCAYDGYVEGIFSPKLLACTFNPEVMAGTELFTYIKDTWGKEAPKVTLPNDVINLSSLDDVEFQLAIERIVGGWG